MSSLLNTPILPKMFCQCLPPSFALFSRSPFSGQWGSEHRGAAEESCYPRAGEDDGYSDRSELTSFRSASTCILACVTAASLHELACLACSNSVFSCWAVLSKELTISSRYSQLRCSDISSPLTTVGETALVGVEGGTAKAGRDVRTRMWKGTNQRLVTPKPDTLRCEETHWW